MKMNQGKPNKLFDKRSDNADVDKKKYTANEIKILQDYDEKYDYITGFDSPGLTLDKLEELIKLS